MTRPRVWSWAAVAGGLLLTLLINYHSYLTNFNLVPGDRGDTRLVVFTLEHWYSAVKGQDAPLQLNMFYPDELALGYADGLILFAFPYVVLRGIGADYFTSYQLVLLILTGFGFGMYALLLRQVLRMRILFAVLGAVLLTCMNSMQLQMDIGKLLAFYFWPALILLLYGYGRSLPAGGWKPRLWLVGFSALRGLLFFTSYYPAWYFVFTALLFGLICYLVASWTKGLKSVTGEVVAFVRSRIADIALAAGVLILALVPFGLTYAPLILSNASRNFALVLEFSPTVRDIVNVGPQNIVWSSPLRALHFDFGNREVQLGCPLAALALFIGLFVLEFRRRDQRRDLQGRRERLIFALAVTALILAALIVKVREASLWYIVYKLVPGASALRAEGRYLMVIDMIILVSVTYGLDRLYAAQRERASSLPPLAVDAGAVLIAVLLVAEEISSTSFRLDKATQLAFMTSFERPAGDCRAFYIANPSQLDLPIGYYQLDAMMVGMKLGIPTVNGYSGIGPDPVFSMVPAGPEYQYGIMNWLRANGVTQSVCELDYQTKTFTMINVNADYDRYLSLVRDQYVSQYATLFGAVSRFVQDKNDPADLYPQFLEQHGYLDASYGFQAGTAYHWIGGKYWIGSRVCGKEQCPAIGIVGTFVEIEEIIQAFRSTAAEIYFPSPQTYDPRIAVAPDVEGELLIVFPISAFAN